MNINAFLGRLLLLAALSAPFGPAVAHPHIFIEQQVAIVFDQGKPTGIRLTWSFDEMYSSMLRTDFTADPKSPITPADVRNLHDKAFTNLASAHYFTDLRLNGDPLAVPEPTDFDARWDHDKAIYSFVLPVRMPALEAANTLEIAVFDPEYYVDIELGKAPVTTAGALPPGARCDKTTVPRETMGYGRVESDVVRCTFPGKA